MSFKALCFVVLKLSLLGLVWIFLGLAIQNFLPDSICNTKNWKVVSSVNLSSLLLVHSTNNQLTFYRSQETYQILKLVGSFLYCDIQSLVCARKLRNCGVSGWEGNLLNKYNSRIDVSLSSPKLFSSKWWHLYLYFRFSHPIVLYMKRLLDKHILRRIFVQKAFRKLVGTGTLPVFLQRLAVATESVPLCF